MNGKRLQNILLGGVIVLVVLLIASKFVYNKVTARLTWDGEDRQELINDCMILLIQDGYAVRFPSASRDYCECQADSIMHKLPKAAWREIDRLEPKERFNRMMQVIAPCYNRYQTEMFNQSTLD